MPSMDRNRRADPEIQLRLKIALLEKEAEEKKKAAEKAIQHASKALKEVDDSGKDANTGTIAQMISLAEKQAAEAAAETEEVRDTDTHMTELLSDTSSPSRNLDSPPMILRNAEPLSPKSAVSGGVDEDLHQLRVCTSGISLMDNTMMSRRSYHQDFMEDTLETLMVKIEECTAILNDPSATVEAQIDAAALATQYAKAAKAFHAACSP